MNGATKRLYFLGAILFLWLGAVIFRLVELQVVKYGEFQQRAAKLSASPVPSRRGEMVEPRVGLDPDVGEQASERTLSAMLSYMGGAATCFQSLETSAEHALLEKLEEVVRGHDLARDAIAALHGALVEERRLERAHPAVDREALDRRDGRAVGLDR